MTMTVKNNLSAINTLNQLDRNQSDLTKQLQKLSSGMNLNTAKDSPSAYAISERMRVQIRGLSQDISNAQNARALMNTAEGAVQSTIEILKTFKDKALDAANDTNTDVDRATIQRELDQLISQIDDNAYVTYNGKILLDGSMGGNMAADEQGVIIDFMSYLDNANLSAQDALDQAINYASGGLFQNENDLKTKFLADMAGGDLLGMCGIDLTNEDTGSITGSDVGGDKAKTAESIVPENGTPFTGDVPSGTSIINGLTVTWPDQSDPAQWSASNQDALKAIAKALNSQWLKICMDLVEESFEINFKEPETSVHSMNVALKEVTSGSMANSLAYVSHSSIGGVANSLTLTVNMSYYNHLDTNNENGYDTESRQTYLDRVIAHEMTHAIMAANIKNFASLPKYIKEGTAELVHGIDDERQGTIQRLASTPADLQNAINNSSMAPGDDAYGAGYMLLRYMAHQAADAEPQKRLVFQIGTKANQAIKVGLANMRSEALGLKKNGKITCQVTTQKKATSALTTIDRALTKAIKQQTSIGAVQSRLEFTTENLTIAHENVTASESTIRDADMAKAFTDYTKANVLLQTAQSMLAQANQNSSSALSLLQ